LLRRQRLQLPELPKAVTGARGRAHHPRVVRPAAASMERPGRQPSFDATTYARRNVAERCVNRLKQWHGIATRYEKWAVT
jgi:transposase